MALAGPRPRPEWRLFRSWSKDELTERIAALDERRCTTALTYPEMTVERGWNRYFSQSVIARERPGAPDEMGPFRRAEVALANYQFSDPAIVVGHFDADSRLLGRRMLLEIKAFRVLHYLSPIVVGAVRFDERDGLHTFGFRCDALDGHIERGSEWFLLTKDAETGEIHFRIEAAWLPGEFPNWWSRVGFSWIAPYYQKRWHHEAHWRLFRVAAGGMSASPVVDERGLAHAGPSVVFERIPRMRTIEEPVWEAEDETIRST